MTDQKPKWMQEHEEADQRAFAQINEKLDEHMATLQPYIQGAAGLGLLWKAVVAIGGLIIVWVQIQSFWK